MLYPHKTKVIKPIVSDNPRRYGKSIDERPEWINNRSEFGHWEIDTMILTKARNKVLLTLTERMTRFEIIRLIDGKTSEAVNDMILTLAKTFDFKSVTADNGSEFSRLSDAVICDVYYKNDRYSGRSY